MTSFASCPLEIRQGILVYIPIKAKALVTVALASRWLLADTLLGSAAFGHQHAKFQWQEANQNELWCFLDSAGIYGPEWRQLPFVYRVGLLKLILTVPDWSQVEDGMNSTENLMNCNRWKLPPQDGDRVLATLLDDPSFTFEAQENRTFRWSARLGYINAVKSLLHNPRVDPTDLDHYAVASTPEDEQPEILSLLLADPRMSPISQNYLALRWACDHDHLETIRILLADSRVDPENNNNYCMITLLKRGQVELARSILEQGRVDPSVGENCVIRTAAAEGLTDIVRLLLNNPCVDPAAATSSALALAAAAGHLETVVVLMEDGRSDPSTFTNHGLRGAAKNGHHEVVRLLLQDERVDPTVLNHFALTESIANGDEKVVQLLLNHPEVVLSAERIRNFIFQRKGCSSITKLLLGYSSVGTPQSRQLLLESASKRGRVDVAETILEDSCLSLDLKPGIASAISAGYTNIFQVLLSDWRFDESCLELAIERVLHSSPFNASIAKLIINTKMQMEVNATDDELRSAISQLRKVDDHIPIQ
ncbi:hypothetical protein BDR26DRAFT_862187 [Obelidium mucronatum]|nr:hypothetical protein BDR26DRAFT_862187 [Obelidium mucronatum]